MMVKFFFCAVIAALAHAVVANDAPKRPDQPKDALIIGVLPGSQKEIYGGIAFWADDGWTTANVYLFGLPSKGLPYSYSINTNALPESGLCTEAGGILNPYGGTKEAPTWAGMMIGDLSGKHGKVDTLNYQVAYEDPYLSIRALSGVLDKSYIGNHAFVVTDKDGTAVACCNLVAYKSLGKMVDMDGEKVPEEFYSMLMEAKKTN